mgnify:CR=1 FL=1
MLFRSVAGLLVAGAALRQIARHLGCAPSTVQRLSVRLGRHATLFQRRAYHEIKRIEEPVVFDHFESFVRSQVERLGVGTPVGQGSWYVFPLSAARYRGSTRRSRRKRALQRAIEPTSPGAVVRSAEKTLEMLLRKVDGELDLVSDDHPAYRSAAGRCGGRIRHRVYANPDRSPGREVRRARSRNREVFAGDLLHKLMRHCQAHHRRETIAFSRRLNALLERAFLLVVWRNFVKGRSERRTREATPAMQVGLTDERWSWSRVLAQRLFPSRIELPERHEGHLEFRGPSATSGYYRNPEATKQLFDGGWLRTGDRAYFADGNLFLTGREKDIIIRGGRNVSPYEQIGRAHV